MRRAWIPVVAVVTGVIGISLNIAVIDSIAGGILARPSAPVAAPPTPAPESDRGPNAPRLTEDEDLGTVDVYRVDASGALVPPPPHGSHEERVWRTFLRVADPGVAGTVVVEYLVGDDWRADTLAYVSRGDDDPRTWTLAVNLAGSERIEELVPTLVHEYGHILTLSVDEIVPDVRPCPTMSLWEGCAAEDSALWAFQQRFWSGYDDAPTPRNSDWDVTDEFYAAHSDDFVSDYAATNVVEDIAESFAVFVLEDAPTGDGVVDRKLAFFAEWPRFVEIRERIRAEFAADLGIIP